MTEEALKKKRGGYDGDLVIPMIEDPDARPAILKKLRGGSAGAATAYVALTASHLPELGVVYTGGVIEYPKPLTGSSWLQLEPMREGGAANMLMQGDKQRLDLGNYKPAKKPYERTVRHKPRGRHSGIDRK